MNTNVVYAGVEIAGLYRSLDGGAHWGEYALPNTGVVSLVIKQNGVDSIMYAGLFGGGVAKLMISDQFVTFDQHIYTPLILR